MPESDTTHCPLSFCATLAGTRLMLYEHFPNPLSISMKSLQRDRDTRSFWQTRRKPLSVLYELQNQ
jgi:hypothetical protein